MQNFFPADVSLRVSGEIADAQRLFPAAKQLLFRAIKMQETGSPIVRLFMPGTDGSLIHVFLHSGLKHVYVQPSLPVERVDEEIPVEPREILPYELRPKMLSGVVTPGTVVMVPNPNNPDKPKPAAHEFHPTQTTTKVYGVPFEWKDNTKIGTAPDPLVSNDALQAKWPKPSMYSGAMKRVVQMLYGLGRQNHYDYRWLRTDGVHKVGNRFWVVRIGKVDGVLAMRLPMYAATTGASFKDVLSRAGDTEMLAVVNEFGGVPANGQFPTGEALEKKIASGRILRLMSAEDLAPFYTFQPEGDADPIARNPYFDACGWAFSNSGAATEAHNTCWWYSRRDISLDATWWDGGWYFDGHMNAPPEDRYMRGEHWKVNITIVNRAPSNGGAPGEPPSGTATLELVEMQPVEAPNCFGLETYGFTLPHYYRNIYWNPDGQGPFESTEEYAPFGSVVPGGSATDLGYGISLTTYFNTSQGGYAGFGLHGSGAYNCLPWLPDVAHFYDGRPTSEFHALSGPGHLSQPVSPRLQNCCVFYGFDPVKYLVELRARPLREAPENVAGSLALFWTHRALMLVPQQSPTSILTRFKFWGRSLCSMPIDEMEPAYAAPVHVFFIGEKLEKVYRQAERWNGGTYTMGDFWGTSLDLRVNSEYETVESPSNPSSRSEPIGGGDAPRRYIPNPPNPEGHIGLIIPQGVREGYVLLRSVAWNGGVSGPNGPVDTTPFGVFAVNGEQPKIVYYTSYETDSSNHELMRSVSPRGEDGEFGLYMEVFMRWDWSWTSMYADTTIKMTVVLNAQTGEFDYSHNGPMRDWNPWDHNVMWPFEPEFMVPQPAIPREGYPRYTINFPTGVALPPPSTDWGIDPVNVTFVGGV